MTLPGSYGNEEIRSWQVLSTELPASTAIQAGDKGGHGLIGAPGLHLEVGGLSLAAFGTLELIGRCNRLHTPLTLKHGLGFDILGLLLPLIACHFVGCQCAHCFWFHFAQQNTPSEVWILIIFDVEHDRPEPQHGYD